MHFSGRIRPLPEGEKDEQQLNVAFTTLGFDVKVHQNLEANEIRSEVKRYAESEPNGVFFLIILSHRKLVNNKEAVIGTDGKAIEIYVLEEFFHSSN